MSSVSSDKFVHQDHVEAILPTPGGMGLKGLWALVGNSTAMMLLAIVLFIMMMQVQSMHKEGIAVLERIVDSQQKNVGAAIRENTDAIKMLSRDLQHLRKQ